MRTRTRQLLALLAEDKVDELLAILGSEPCSEPEIRGRLQVSHAFLAERLQLLQAFGAVGYELDPSSGRGRPPRRWHVETPRLLDAFATDAEAFAVALAGGDPPNGGSGFSGNRLA
jgi:predicted ArsR family transcriptional regulator